MKINVVNEIMTSALNNYKKNDTVFVTAIRQFAEEGKKSPTRAHIALQEYYRNTANTLLNNENKAQKQTDHFLSSAKKNLYSPISRLEAEETAVTTKTAILLHTISAFSHLSEVIEKAKVQLYNEKNLINLYPKTLKIRRALADRMFLDKVKPKSGWDDKVEVLSSLKDFRNIYPKTYVLRVNLIINQRVKEGVTTHKLKWFEKLKYKKFLNKTNKKR